MTDVATMKLIEEYERKFDLMISRMPECDKYNLYSKEDIKLLIMQ